MGFIDVVWTYWFMQTDTPRKSHIKNSSVLIDGNLMKAWGKTSKLHNSLSTQGRPDIPQTCLLNSESARWHFTQHPACMEICVLSSSLATKKNVRFAAGPNDCRRFLHEILLFFEHSHFQKSRMSSRCSRLEQAAQNISEHRLPTLDLKMQKNALVSLEEALCRKGLFSREAVHLFSCFSFSSKKTIKRSEFCRLRRIWNTARRIHGRQAQATTTCLSAVVVGTPGWTLSGALHFHIGLSWAGPCHSCYPRRLIVSSVSIVSVQFGSWGQRSWEEAREALAMKGFAVNQNFTAAKSPGKPNLEVLASLPGKYVHPRDVLCCPTPAKCELTMAMVHSVSVTVTITSRAKINAWRRLSPFLPTAWQALGWLLTCTTWPDDCNLPCFAKFRCSVVLCRCRFLSMSVFLGTLLPGDQQKFERFNMVQWHLLQQCSVYLARHGTEDISACCGMLFFAQTKNAVQQTWQVTVFHPLGICGAITCWIMFGYFPACQEMASRFYRFY